MASVAARSHASFLLCISIACASHTFSSHSLSRSNFLSRTTLSCSFYLISASRIPFALKFKFTGFFLAFLFSFARFFLALLSIFSRAFNNSCLRCSFTCNSSRFAKCSSRKQSCCSLPNALYPSPSYPIDSPRAFKFSMFSI